MEILITGFEPFGGQAVNPAWLAVERLPGFLAGARIEKRLLPVRFREAGEMVRQALLEKRPQAALLVGQAGGRARMSVERVAINLDDARIPDNGGDQPLDQPIRPDGPAAYFATLPTRAMVAAMEAAGVPAELSLSAGSYVCNHTMYCALDAAAGMGLPTRAGFLHVPFLPEQAVATGSPSLPLEQIVRGLEAAIRAIAENA